MSAKKKATKFTTLPVDFGTPKVPGLDGLIVALGAMRDWKLDKLRYEFAPDGRRVIVELVEQQHYEFTITHS